jgi:hypothetical protein
LLKLTGALFFIQWRMIKNGHLDDATKMGFIIEMVIHLNPLDNNDTDGAIVAIIKEFDESRS